MLLCYLEEALILEVIGFERWTVSKIEKNQFEVEYDELDPIKVKFEIVRRGKWKYKFDQEDNEFVTNIFEGKEHGKIARGRQSLEDINHTDR